MGIRDLNSGPHASKTNTLASEESPILSPDMVCVLRPGTWGLLIRLGCLSKGLQSPQYWTYKHTLLCLAFVHGFWGLN